MNMKSQLIILFVFVSSLTCLGQNSILYDFDSYKRVSGAYRTTFITPDINLSYRNVLNTPEQVKFYNLNIGGRYADNQIFNDENNQKTKSTDIDFGIGIGNVKNISFEYNYDYENRAYNDMTYFKNGFHVRTNNQYIENLDAKRYTQSLNLGFDLGFGFGRLEIINNAWLGARILEELQIDNLLMKLPSTEEMTEFFDLIGDLEFERVMDPRLRSMYRVEKMIMFIEQKGWIENGSIPSFIKIYDAFRYENFIFRRSGERLEFTLTPTFIGNFNYSNLSQNKFSKFIQPGFFGRAEYEIHKNGDLAYNTTKLVGGEVGYFEILQDDPLEGYTHLTGNVFFRYIYRYLPSLRTNLIFTSNVSAGLIYIDSYKTRLNINSSVEYDYYFSPATRLAMVAEIKYLDTKFQVGDYQPSIDATFSLNVIHSIR